MTTPPQPSAPLMTIHGDRFNMRDAVPLTADAPPAVELAIGNAVALAIVRADAETVDRMIEGLTEWKRRHGPGLRLPTPDELDSLHGLRGRG